MFNETNNKLISIAILIGFIGDLGLQLISKVRGGNSWGLEIYFKQHSLLVSALAAAGTLGIIYVFYTLTNIPVRLQWLILIGVVLDIIFRYTNAFPSLQLYYNSINPFWTAFWSAISIILPLLILRCFDKNVKLI